jgi:hypothetical protein
MTRNRTRSQARDAVALSRRLRASEAKPAAGVRSRRIPVDGSADAREAEE